MPRANKLTPFGKKVKKRMLDLDVTTKALAEEIGCQSPYLSMMLYGVKSVTRYEPRIRAALGMDDKCSKGA